MSDEQSAPKLPEIVPDFFAEVISRIIPGLVLIAFWLHASRRQLTDALPATGTWLFLLAAAWVIGVALDTGVYVPLRWLLAASSSALAKRFPGAKTWLENSAKEASSPWGDTAKWEYFRAAPPWERNNAHKAFALLILFRGMACAGALVLAAALACELHQAPSSHHWYLDYTPLGDWASQLHSWQGLHSHPGLYESLGGLSSVVFLICWHGHRGEIKKLADRVEQEQKKREAAAQSAAVEKAEQPATSPKGRKSGRVSPI